MTKHGVPGMGFFSPVWAFFEINKVESLKLRKEFKTTPNGWTKHACCLTYGCIRHGLSLKGKRISRKCIFFFFFFKTGPSFSLDVFYHVRHVESPNKIVWGPFRFLWR